MSDTSTALAVRRPAALTASGYNPPPSQDEFQGMIYMAKQLAEASGFVPAHFYKQPNKILAAMLYGRDLGITPTNALQHIIVIEGKATADAQLMGMLVRRAGHRLEDKTTATASTVTITRGDDGSVHSFTFTMDDAARAGLVKAGSAWQKYPQAMLYARALTGCARKGAQDALMGVAYTPEELGAEVDVIDGETVVMASPQVSGVPEASAGNQTIPTVAAIQPAPPALAAQQQPRGETPPESGVPESAPASAPPAAVPASGGTSEGAPATNGASETSPAAAPPAPPPTAAVMPLAGPALSRRMGAGASIGPRPRRTNTVTIEPQAAETPATAPEVASAPVAAPDVAAGQQAAPDLLEEAVLPQAEDEGRRVYLDTLRQALRDDTATLFRVNTILDNVKAGLEGKEQKPVPPATPTEASDAALARRIEGDWPGRTLANLGEVELSSLAQRFEASLAKKRELMKERGISEE